MTPTAEERKELEQQIDHLKTLPIPELEAACIEATIDAARAAALMVGAAKIARVRMTSAQYADYCSRVKIAMVLDFGVDVLKEIADAKE